MDSCVSFVCGYLFLFFKQKTAYEMRISDWSSDVCSSDLPRRAADAGNRRDGARRLWRARPICRGDHARDERQTCLALGPYPAPPRAAVGDAADRKSVV